MPDCPAFQQEEQPCSARPRSRGSGPTKNDPDGACNLPEDAATSEAQQAETSPLVVSQQCGSVGHSDVSLAEAADHHCRSVVAEHTLARDPVQQMSDQMGLQKSCQRLLAPPGQNSQAVGTNVAPGNVYMNLAAQLMTPDQNMQVKITAGASQAHDGNVKAPLLIPSTHSDAGLTNSSLPLPKQFSFVMLFSGYIPQAAEVLRMQQRVESINIPSLHCFGSDSQDWQVSTAASQTLMKWFSQDQDQCITKTHPAGHKIPSAHIDTEQYVAFMDAAMLGSIDDCMLRT